MNMKPQITTLDKQSLRRLSRQLKNQMSADEKLLQSDSIFTQIEQSDYFAKADTIASYWSLDDEVETHRFIERWATRKNIYLPIVVGNDLVFRQFTSTDNMREGAFGIMEPTGEQLGNQSEIKMVIVPGVAFDRQNNRMGRGRGFYDRILSATNAFKVGVAYKCQMFEQIPTCDNDIPMDTIVIPK